MSKGSDSQGQEAQERVSRVRGMWTVWGQRARREQGATAVVQMRKDGAGRWGRKAGPPSKRVAGDSSLGPR